MKERLILFLSHLGAGQNKFEAMCGIANGTINNMRDNMTVKTLLKISDTCPDLNINWLMTGKGDMLIPQNKQHIGDVSNSNVVGVNLSGNGIQITHNDFTAFLEVQKETQAALKKKRSAHGRYVCNSAQRNCS